MVQILIENSSRQQRCHDDVIKWKHFPRYWPFVRGIHRSPVNSAHKGQWRGTLMFSLIYVWMNGWGNNREIGYRAHCVVSVMVAAGVYMQNIWPQICVPLFMDMLRYYQKLETCRWFRTFKTIISHTSMCQGPYFNTYIVILGTGFYGMVNMLFDKPFRPRASSNNTPSLYQMWNATIF